MDKWKDNRNLCTYSKLLRDRSIGKSATQVTSGLHLSLRQWTVDNINKTGLLLQLLWIS